jgi:hypothetical protein
MGGAGHDYYSLPSVDLDRARDRYSTSTTGVLVFGLELRRKQLSFQRILVLSWSMTPSRSTMEAVSIRR